MMRQQHQQRLQQQQQQHPMQLQSHRSMQQPPPQFQGHFEHPQMRNVQSLPLRAQMDMSQSPQIPGPNDIPHAPNSSSLQGLQHPPGPISNGMGSRTYDGTTSGDYGQNIQIDSNIEPFGQLDVSGDISDDEPAPDVDVENVLDGLLGAIDVTDI